MAIELIKISEFPQVSEPGDWIVVSDAAGTGYKISKEDFKAWLGTVQVQVPKALAPSDPEPTLDGVYIPTVTKNEAGTDIIYTNAGGLTVNTAEGGDDYGMSVQFIKNGAVYAKVDTPMPVQDISGEISKLSGYFNCSFNTDTGGTIIFTTKQEARNSVPTEMQKRGLVITYNLSELSGWIIEQYIGSADWADTDDSYINISNKKDLRGSFYGNGVISYSAPNLILPSGVIAVSDGRRQDTTAATVPITEAYSNIIYRPTVGIMALPITERLQNMAHNSDEGGADILIGTVRQVGSKFQVLDGSGFSLNSEAPLLLKNERLSILSNTKEQIVFDLSNRKIHITGGYVLGSPTTGRYTLPTTDVDMLVANANAAVLYSIKDNSVVVRNVAAPPLDDHLILFTYRYSGSRESFGVNGLNTYSIMGESEDATPNEYLAILSLANKSLINFEPMNRKIIISGGYIIDTFGSSRIPLPITEVDMPAGVPFGVVLFNKNDNTVVVRNQASPSRPNHLVLFTYGFTGALSSFIVNGLENYSVDGIPNGVLDYRQVEKLAVDNIAVPFYNAPAQEGAGTTDPFSLYDLTSQILNGLYDSAATGVSAVTKTLIGQTESPTPYDVFKYSVKFRDARSLTRVKPKIIMVGGTHGGELLGVYTTYLLFNQIVNNSDKSLMVEMLRKNYDFVFVPCNNPFALNVGSVNGAPSVRWNHNGVDINRNFDWRWENFPDEGMGSQVYKGTAPFSEKESRMIRDTIIAELENTVLVVDVHNYGGAYSESYGDVWYSTARRNIYNICNSLSDRIAFEFKKQFPEIGENDLVAYADYGLSLPTLSAWVSNVLNVDSLTLETSQSSVYDTEGYTFDSAVVTRSLTAHVNSVYSIAKHVIDFKNIAE